MKDKTPKPERVGFRRRINPYYGGMNKKQIARDVAKDTARWLAVSALGFAYWFAMLMIFSIFLLNVWHVTLSQILIWSGVLTAITSVVYALMLVHRKFYY